MPTATSLAEDLDRRTVARALPLHRNVATFERELSPQGLRGGLGSGELVAVSLLQTPGTSCGGSADHCDDRMIAKAYAAYVEWDEHSAARGSIEHLSRAVVDGPSQTCTVVEDPDAKGVVDWLAVFIADHQRDTR